jgi:uncharacterized membrane protein YeaQ/YmgE (transglycosylase-associated protein family)
MEIIGFIVFGLVVGAIARFLMPGRDPGGFFATTMIGMIGALVGGLIGRYLLGRGEGYTPGWIMSIAGALILLWLYRRFSCRQAP